MKRVILAVGALLLAATPATAQNVGDRVLAKWTTSTDFFPGVVASRTASSASVVFDDGTTDTRPLSELRRYDWTVGTRLACRWTDGRYYSGKVGSVGSDGRAIYFLYDDGDRLQTNTSACRTLPGFRGAAFQTADATASTPAASPSASDRDVARAKAAAVTAAAARRQTAADTSFQLFNASTLPITHFQMIGSTGTPSTNWLLKAPGTSVAVNAFRPLKFASPGTCDHTVRITFSNSMSKTQKIDFCGRQKKILYVSNKEIWIE